MKILHMSDAHLGRAQYGLPEREEDYYRAFREGLMRGKTADAVVITGDVFDSRRPSTRAMLRFVEAVEGVELPVYVIGGNHDFSYVRYRAEAEQCGGSCAGDTVLRLLDRVKLAKLLCWSPADLGGLVLFGACATPRDYAAEYRKLLQKAPPGALLAIHQAVEGVQARYPAEEDDYTMPQSVFQGLSYIHIAAGHIHDHFAKHPIGAVWAGSIEVWDSGEFETWEYAGRFNKVQERATKGVVLIDAAGRGVSVKSIPLPDSRPLYRLRIYVREGKELAGAVEEAARLFDKPGAVVRLEIMGTAEEGVKTRQLAAAFTKALYVDVVDRTSAPQRAVALRGSAFEELWRLLREKLGGHAEVVIRAMELVREGERETAYRLVLKALYD